MIDINHVVAVDIGATKAAIAIVSNKLEVIKKTEVPTGSNSDIWSRIEKATQLLIDSFNFQIDGVGIASAGPINLKTGSISPVNISNWREFPIVERFSKLLGASNIVLHGDAVALAHAEYKIGAGKGCTSMLGMVVSTGIGGGLIINGKVFNGISGNAGYFGHHSISYQSEVCNCGRSGCVELFASGPKMVAYAKEIGWQGISDDFQALAESAKSGDQIALTSINKGAQALANGIVNVLCILDINTVVVGGGVTQAGAIYWDALSKHVQAESQKVDFIKQVDLRKSELSRDAGLIGAALAVLDK